MPRRPPLALLLLTTLSARASAGSAPAAPPPASALYDGYLVAAALEQDGKFSEALAATDALLKKNPGEAALHHLRARLLLRAGDPETTVPRTAQERRREMERRAAAMAARVAEAERESREAVRLAPDEPLYRRDLGSLLTENEPLTEARRREAALHLERAAALDADDGIARAMLFGLYHELGEPAKALEWGRAAVKLQPANAGLRAALARALDEAGEGAEAAAQWILVLRRGWGATAAAAGEALRRRLRAGGLDPALELNARSALYEDDPDDLIAAIDYLQALLKNNRGGDALGVAISLRARNPQDARVGRLLEAVAWQTGRLDLALEEARVRLRRDPLDPEAADAVVRLLDARDDFAGVRAAYDEPVWITVTLTPAQALRKARALFMGGKRAEALALLAKHGDDFSARLEWIARFRALRGRWPTAAEAAAAGLPAPASAALLRCLTGARDAESLREAIGRTPAASDDPPAEAAAASGAEAKPLDERKAGLLLAALRESDPRAAASLAAALLADDPDNEGYALQRAEALDAAGDGAGAIAQYEALRKKRPEDAGIANNLAYLIALRAPARLPEAVALAGEAVARSPEDASFLDTLAWTHQMSGRSEIAQPLLEQALRNGGRSAVILAHLAAVRAARGDRPGALTLLKEADGQAENGSARREVAAVRARIAPRAPAAAAKPRPRPPARPAHP